MPGDEYRTMPNVTEGRIGSARGIVGFRQTPQIMIAQQIRVAGKTGPDSNLVIERLGVVVPHLLEPVEPELGLARKVRRASGSAHLLRKVADADQHEGHGVAVRFNEL